MRQLTRLDAQFLALETARQSGHVAGLAILDPSTAPGGRLDVIDLQALIAERPKEEAAAGGHAGHNHGGGMGGMGGMGM